MTILSLCINYIHLKSFKLPVTSILSSPLFLSLREQGIWSSWPLVKTGETLLKVKVFPVTVLKVKYSSSVKPKSICMIKSWGHRSKKKKHRTKTSNNCFKLVHLLYYRKLTRLIEHTSLLQYILLIPLINIRDPPSGCLFRSVS